MKEEEITGVCVDIPQVLRCAKKHKNDRCSHLNYPAEFCPEGYAICSGCKQRYSTFSYPIDNECFGEKSSNWISVADRLPEEGQKVFALEHTFIYWTEFKDGVFRIDIDGQECREVTRWFPFNIPAPPKI